MKPRLVLRTITRRGVASGVCLLAGALVLGLATAAAGQELDQGEVQRLFRAGTAAYAAGRFREALDHAEQAYRLKRHHVLRYNIGQASRRLWDSERELHYLRRALEAYRDVAADPTAGLLRRDAARFVRELETVLAAMERSAPPTVPPHPGPAGGPAVGPAARQAARTGGPLAADSATGARRWQPLVIGGAAAVVLVGVGAGYGLLARSRNADSKPYCPTANQCYAEGVALRTNAGRAADVATGCFIAGGVVAAAAVTLWLTLPRRRSHEARRAWLVPTAGPTGGVVTLAGRW
jgi:tetratricopeptide (TPR) repeat protein